MLWMIIIHYYLLLILNSGQLCMITIVMIINVTKIYGDMITA